MFFKKEKAVVKLILEHLDLVESCTEKAVETIAVYLVGDTGKAKGMAQDVGGRETKADLIRYRIRDKLYSGAYLPLIREDIYKLVESVDKVANAGEACSDFFLNQRPEVPQTLVEDFQKIVRLSLGTMTPLKAAVTCFLRGECGIEVVREQSKAVGIQESKADKLEWDLTKTIFTADLEYSHKIHLKLCLDSIVEVSDRAEDAADQLQLTALKSMG